MPKLHHPRMSSQLTTLLPTPIHRRADSIRYQSSAPECRNEARILAECSRPNERSEVASLSPTARDMCGPRLEHAPDGYESGAEQEVHPLTCTTHSPTHTHTSLHSMSTLSWRVW